jgi:hypothetical protein
MMFHGRGHVRVGMNRGDEDGQGWREVLRLVVSEPRAEVQARAPSHAAIYIYVSYPLRNISLIMVLR